MRNAVIMLLALSISFFGFDLVKAAEHPGHEMEHPGEEMEHAEDDFPVTANDVKQAIENYVKKDSELKGGYFLVYDGQDKVIRQLKFERVHDRVSELKKSGEYFACSDFTDATKGNAKLDLDFWFENGEDGLEVRKITIHKVADKARYTFKDDEIAPVQ